MKNHNLLIKLAASILAGIAVGGGAYALGVSNSAAFVLAARVAATFTSLFSTLLNFIIPLLILSFIAVGLAELRAGAGRLAGITLALAYASTITSGAAAFFPANIFCRTLSEALARRSLKKYRMRCFLQLRPHRCLA